MRSSSLMPRPHPPLRSGAGREGGVWAQREIFGGWGGSRDLDLDIDTIITDHILGLRSCS